MRVKTRIRVNEAGRVVIPAAFRERLGIHSGDELVCEIDEDALRITTIKTNLERAQRLVQRLVKPGRSLADELIAERRAAARDE